MIKTRRIKLINKNKGKIKRDRRYRNRNIRSRVENLTATKIN